MEPEVEAAIGKLLETGRYGLKVQHGWSIDMARNALASDAYNEGYEGLMWIDSDVLFDPADVDKLRDSGHDIICGLYPKKGMPELASRFLPGTTEVQLGAGGSIMEIEHAGTGFLYTKRKVYESLINIGIEHRTPTGLPLTLSPNKKPIWPFFLPLVDEHGNYLGEDFAFCWRARKAMYMVMADTTIRLMHIGRHAFSWEDLAPMRRYGGCSVRINQG